MQMILPTHRMRSQDKRKAFAVHSLCVKRHILNSQAIDVKFKYVH